MNYRNWSKSSPDVQTESDIIGIVAGTLGVSKYLDIIHKVQKLIADAGKKSYLLLVGKVSNEKLCNFPEIDLFVLIACPFSVMLDSVNYFKDVITPFECEMACEDADWTGKYSTDFGVLLGKQDI